MGDFIDVKYRVIDFRYYYDTKIQHKKFLYENKHQAC